MPRWFGVNYNRQNSHNQSHHHSVISEEVGDEESHRHHQQQQQQFQQQQQQQSPNQDQVTQNDDSLPYDATSSSFFQSMKTHLFEKYFKQYFHSERPVDYFYNPDYHDGFLHEYLQMTLAIRELVENDQFNYAILVVIVIAGINIGVQSYNSLDQNPILSILDTCILIVFSLECILKILAEGIAPYNYFIGADWKWNTFDFTIVFMSLPFWGSLFGGGSLALLRLVRLMRLGKLIQKVPQLQMIVQGLTGGLSSIGYILLLLFLVFYLFSVAGYYVFHQNDPFHFGSIPKAFVTCFICATLDTWSDIMYVNSFGCDEYPMVYEFYNETTAKTNLLKCSTPKPQFVVSTIFFISLVVITALVMLSLFIGAVTLSMQDSLTELKESTAEKKRQEKIKKQLNKMFQTRADVNYKNGASKHLKGRVMSRMSSFKNLKMIRSQSSSEDSNDGYLHTANKKFFGYFSTSSKDIQLPHPNISASASAKLGEVEGNILESASISQKHHKLAQTPSSIKLNLQPGIPHQDPSSFSDSNSSSNLKGPKPLDQVSSQGIGISGKLSPEELMIQSQISFSTESEETVEMRRKLRIGIGDLAPGIEDEPKSWDIFLTRWAMTSKFSEKLILLAEHIKFLAEHPYFVEFVTYVIILAGITVGMRTEPRLTELPHAQEILNITDVFILAVFTIECLMKLFGEYPKPWNYFSDSWNKFDFIIVVGSYTPGVGSLLTILRLLRLLRVLKLVKSLPQLVVIVDALMMGIESIAYIGLILFLCFYVFAIIGMMLFRANDPFNFGNLHISMFTLFRCATLDAWADIMYVNVYGCDVYPGETYSGYPELCTSPRGSGVVAVLYFFVFIVIGAQILLTLFIGVVTTSMEEAQAKELRENKIERQLLSLKSSLDLTSVQIRMFREVFNTLDLDGGGSIEEDEVQIGLKAIGDLIAGTNVEQEIKNADPHGEGIDLVTFIVVFCNIPSCRHRRVLRKTVKRWIANKRKKGLFFQAPRRNIGRPNANKSIWAKNALHFFESVENRFTSRIGNSEQQHLEGGKESHEPQEATTKDSTRHSFFSYFSSNKTKPLKTFNFPPSSLPSPHSEDKEWNGDDDDKDDKDESDAAAVDLTPPMMEKKPSLNQIPLSKRRGSLVRRSSTTTLYQTPHEMETAVLIGHQLSHSPELERSGSGRRSHSSELLLSGRRSFDTSLQSPPARRSPSPRGTFGDRQSSMSPTLVHDFRQKDSNGEKGTR